jgi:MoaA/NifB/PqqE/SkfB family radical SAM enzyme
METRYDYLLHSTVPLEESWGLPRWATHVDAPALVSPEVVDAARDAYLASGERDRDALVEYKRLNYALALDEGRRMVSECRSRPFVVQVSRTEKCNLSCTYCRPTPAHQSKLTLARDVWQSALPPLLRPALEFIPYCWGEPLMAPDFDLTCDYADHYGTAVSFITNMMYLDEGLAQLVVRSVDRALVSIDAADPAEFRRVRRGGSVQRIEDNLGLLRRAAADGAGTMPWLGVSSVLMRSGLSYFPGLVRWAAEQGFGGVSARRVMIREPLQGLEKSEEIDLDSAEYREVLAEVREIAAEHELLLNVPDPDFCLGANAMCPCPWHHVYMSASATLAMCCFSHRDVVGHAPVDDNSWNSPELVAHRKHWTPTFRCDECSSLDFVGRPEVSQVRGY